MKIIHIALKDMLRYFRSALAIGFMFVIPLLITGLIYAAFGGVLASSETEAYTLPVIKIQVANLDQGDPQLKSSYGQVLIDALTDESVKNVFAVTLAVDEAAARAAVDRQEAALALIVPANFSQAAVSGKEKAEVAMVQDPTLKFGPGITKEVVSQFLDALSGGQILTRVVADQFAAQGQALEPAAASQAQLEYVGWFKSVASSKQWNLPVIKRLPNKETPKSIADHRTTLLGPVMAGMLIFFVFFTGANTAQSILKEQEEGTLARLFTTPTPVPVILGGKFTAVFLTLIVQSVVLTIASALAFQIDWGNLLALGLVLAGLVVAATGFGILIIAFLKSSRQAGGVIGGVLAVTGMLSGLYTTGFQGLDIFEKIGMATPQGWALRGMKLVLSGAAPQDVLVPLAAMLAFGVIFFAAGSRMFSKRFA
jgi:ABC-2 type transport system permease protein